MTEFYSDIKDVILPLQFTPETSPLMFQPIVDLESINATVLSTGNLVTELIPVTRWLNENRLTVINKYNSVKSILEVYKTEQKQHYEDFQNYLHDNIFTSQKENKEYLVPTSIISLGMFFTGRIICSNNYKGIKNYLPVLRAGNQTLLSTIITSTPSRLIVPWMLMGSAFTIGTPQTWNNFVNVVSNKWLPSEFVENFKKYWDQSFDCSKQTEKVDKLVNVQLPKFIKHIRETINEQFNSSN